LKILILSASLGLLITATGNSQISRPKVYTAKTHTLPIDQTSEIMALNPDGSPAGGAPGAPAGGGTGTGGAVSTTADKPSAQQAFSTGNISLPTSGSSQFAASSRVYMLSVYGTPKCTNGTCVSQYWFRAAIDANVVNSVKDAAGTIREYLFSQSGSPLTLTIPTHTWTTQKSQVDRQTWFAGSFFGSGRLIPVSGTSNTGTNNNTSTSNNSGLTGGGAVTLGGTGQVNIEFDATTPGDDKDGKATVYPGTLSFQFSPSISVLAGGPLKTAVFQGIPKESWTWGGDFKAAFQFQGKQPISLGITGTFSGKGITTSDKGVAISLSKLLGGGS
jgi:hypothetical protein